MALHKPATQSSTSGPAYAAKNAVDGVWQRGMAEHWIKLGDDRGFETIFTHTNKERNAWLKIDLEHSYDIDNVTIYNRTDGCDSRLFPARVFLLPDESEAERLLIPDSGPIRPDLIPLLQADAISEQRITASMYGQDEAVPHRISCPRVHGTARYIVVVLEEENWLHVAQVEAWAVASVDDVAVPSRNPDLYVTRADREAMRRILMLDIQVSQQEVSSLMRKHDGVIANVILELVGIELARRAIVGVGPSSEHRDDAIQNDPARIAGADGSGDGFASAREADTSVAAASPAAQQAPAVKTKSKVCNVAVRKPCWQSSTWDERENAAMNAVDGIWQDGLKRERQKLRAQKRGMKGAAASLGLALGVGFNLGFDTIHTHTQFEMNAWIIVDLGQCFDVAGVAIFNRTCLLERGRLFPSYAMLLPDVSSGGKDSTPREVDSVLPLLVSAGDSKSGRRGVIPGLLERVRSVAIAEQRITADMEGADGTIGHRILCPKLQGPGRFVVLMLEGKSALHIAQIQAWAHVPADWEVPDDLPTTGPGNSAAEFFHATKKLAIMRGQK